MTPRQAKTASLSILVRRGPVVPEVTMEVVSSPIVARPTKLEAVWSADVEQAHHLAYQNFLCKMTAEMEEVILHSLREPYEAEIERCRVQNDVPYWVGG